MTKYVLALCAAAAALFLAQTAVALPPATTCMASGCYSDVSGDLRVDPSAATSTWEYPWVPTVAVTVYPAAQVLDGAKALCFENRSSGTCYWRPANGNLDPSTLTTSGSSGERFQAGDMRCYDQATARFLTNSTAACTAATSATAPLMTRQWK